VIVEQLAGKRVAVTGSTGFLGTALVERLLRSVPDCSLILLVRPGRRGASARAARDVLKNDAFEEVVLNHLYKHTALQSTFGAILLSIVNNRPRVLSLREMLQHYISHRREVVLRRTRFELKKARERAHILEGNLIALDHIDEVIALIRASATVAEARTGLMARFGLTDLQANAILEMRLQRLTGMERSKIEAEVDEIKSILDDTAGKGESPLYAQAQQTARLGDLFLRRFEHRIEQAVLLGDIDDARALQMLKMRMMRGFSGLWLMINRSQ